PEVEAHAQGGDRGGAVAAPVVPGPLADHRDLAPGGAEPAPFHTALRVRFVRAAAMVSGSAGETAHLPTASTARTPPARPSGPGRRSIRPSAARARRTRSPGGPCAGSGAWRGGPASCRNSRRGRRSGRDAGGPSARPFSGTPHTPGCGRGPVPDRRNV